MKHTHEKVRFKKGGGDWPNSIWNDKDEYIGSFENLDDSIRYTLTHNAANGMTNEQAVRYLEHGGRALIHLKEYRMLLETMLPDEDEAEEGDGALLGIIDNLIANMEGK